MKKDNTWLIIPIIAVIMMASLWTANLGININKEKAQSLLITNDSLELVLQEKYKWAQLRLGIDKEIQNVFTVGDTTFFILVPDTITIINSHK